jgi:hypothetical protein
MVFRGPLYGIAVLSCHRWSARDLLDFEMLLHASFIDGQLYYSFSCYVLIVKFSYDVAAFGYPGAKSSITQSLAGCMGLQALVRTLQWSTLHGLSLILKRFGKFLTELSESILLVILQDSRFVIFCFFNLRILCALWG